MFRFYTPVLILQGFCLYHAYRTGRSQTWFYLIIFLPLLGSILYLYDTFVTRRNIEDLSEGLMQTMNSNRKIELLEKERKIADTINNKMALADAYLEIGRVEEAIHLYKLCKQQQPSNKDNIKKLMQAHYLNKDYDKVVGLGSELEMDYEFRNAPERIALAWSLHETGASDAAAKEFDAMDVRYSNYLHRFEYAKFLNLTNQYPLAKAKLEELIEEYQDMSMHEKRFKREIHREAKKLYLSLK